MKLNEIKIEKTQYLFEKLSFFYIEKFFSIQYISNIFYRYFTTVSVVGMKAGEATRNQILNGI